MSGEAPLRGARMTKDEMYEVIREVVRDGKRGAFDKLTAAFEQMHNDPAFTQKDKEAVLAFLRKEVAAMAARVAALAAALSPESDVPPWEQQATQFERERDT